METISIKSGDDSHQQKTLKIENTDKRDVLVEIEKKYQEIWANNHVFETAAPSSVDIPIDSISPQELRTRYPKFFATMAYPYMNGTLHVGHGFTISKAEFAAGYLRMQGKRVLLPLGFHCTGMAIKACADKLVREIEMFGQNFERYIEDIPTHSDIETPQDTTAAASNATDVTKFKSSKSKTAAKSGKAKYQFQIMLSLGISKEDIHRFADPYHWVNVFPEAGMQDLASFGLRVDWRRSFVTTDANPYYDSFVRWQMNKLKELGKIKFGKRYTVYSPLDQQPCLDHDRSEGEGITVQEYTAVKIKVRKWSELAKPPVQDLPPNAKVYFIAATLRPETIYGVNGCFVGPSITYGIFHTSGDEYIVISNHAARNMAFQGIFPEWGKIPEAVTKVSGKEILGTHVDAPLSYRRDEGVRVLPMETIKEVEGTGIVSSIPANSPSHYAHMIDLANKPDYHGIKEKWLVRCAFSAFNTPAYGTLPGPALVKRNNIKSPKDPKLTEFEEIACKEEFYRGIMFIGTFAKKPVQQARPLIKDDLIKSGLAFNYAEPDGMVISRSKDECVAAHLDQWYLNYGTEENGGDGEWCKNVIEHLDSGNLNTFSTEAKNQFENTLGWLGQWACARSYGLGSKLPWDQSFIVESLSDSTIYPAYYTIAHYLHMDIYGKEQGIGNISVQQMTDEVWDYVFARVDEVDTDIELDTLRAMRREFTYWYPLDLRVSGKDLMQNHLIFFLYIHAAIWPEEYWPRGIRPNGHLLLNGDKMAKSTGNFLTLRETVEKFGADASRIAIADAGDSIEDANFEEAVANKTILKLYELKKWLEEVIQEPKLIDSAEEYAKMRDDYPGKNLDTVQRKGDFNIWDKLFQNELRQLANEARKSYDGFLFKGALRFGFYDFTTARDFYREVTRAARCGMHHDLIREYAEFQSLLLAPIAPHWADYVWQEILENSTTVNTAPFPESSKIDTGLTATLNYIRATISNVTSAQASQEKKLAKGKNTPFDPRKPFQMSIFCTTTLPEWQSKCLDLVHEEIEKTGDCTTLDMKAISQSIDQKHAKKAMSFVVELKRRINAGEPSSVVLDKKLSFNELAILKEMDPILRQVLPKLEKVVVLAVDEDGKSGGADVLDSMLPTAACALPSNPTFYFEN
ncbi:hypothetical protein F5B20DRAFT_589294 [Whalleya microplaca]|nr:hypothetical protein F5B20DRAFT_589294 [Whalleya microplaca]